MTTNHPRTEIVLSQAAEMSRSTLEVIASIMKDPKSDVDKLERVLAVQMAIIADERKAAYMAAKHEAQARMPQIERTGRIVVKGTERSRYAKLEDIDEVARPILNELGLSVSYGSRSTDARIFVITCKLQHRDGYGEENELTLPIDSSDFRSVVQNAGSTISYARRQLLKMHLNIIERNEDTDANGPEGFLNDEQVSYLQMQLDKLESATAGATKKFLAWIRVEKLGDIAVRDFDRCKATLQRNLDQYAPRPT